jgi:hypothetical protein
MRDIAPRLQETLDRDALFQMLAIVPAVEIGLIWNVDVHRRQQHALPGERHCSCPSHSDPHGEERAFARLEP